MRTWSAIIGGLILATLSAAAARAADEPTPAVVIYARDNAPATPKLEGLPLKESVAHNGVTWTFDKPVRCGQFVNGDWYVVGEATVAKIDPPPLWGDEVKDTTDQETKKHKKEELIRNGSLLNIPLDVNLDGFDSRNGNFTAKLRSRPPIAMKAGDALISTISEVKPHGTSGGSSAVHGASVLTCLKEPVPADAFRPSYGDRQQTIYLARNLHRELLLNLPRPEKFPALPPMAKAYAAPWLEVVFFGQDGASYQKEYGRAACQLGVETTLSLLMDYKPEEKEPLLINYVQYAVDIYGLVKNGFHGWVAWGGWGSGRKWPIVFAGIMLGDPEMAHINKTLPKAQFGEDMQTMVDKGWSGAGVVYAGHAGKEGGAHDYTFGPYEHLHASRWMIGMIGQAYRGDMTSSTWVGQALVIHLMGAEEAWGYQPFLDYCDRWMYEPDPGFSSYGKQGEGYKTWSWFKGMWDKYRTNLPPVAGKPRPPVPTTGWKIDPPQDSASVAVEIGKNRELRVKGQPFFPLMMFAETPARIEVAKSLGLNTIAEGNFQSQGMKDYVNNAAFMDELAKNGLYGVFGADMRVAGHPNLLGWLQVDQPDRVLGVKPEEWKKVFPCYDPLTFDQRVEKKPLPPPQILVSSAYDWMKKVGKTRPVFLTLGASFMKGEGALEQAVKEKEYPEYLKSCDVAGCAVYPITAGQGEGRLAAVAKAVAELREMAGTGKPVFAWIETRGREAKAAGRGARGAPEVKATPSPTPAQVRAEAWMAIINGATALGYRGFEGFGDVKPDPAMAAEIKRLNDQITRLAPSLLADPAAAKVTMAMGDTPCQQKATEQGGVLTIFAQSLDDKAASKATITVAGLKAGTSIEVVDENRTLTGGDGQFSDAFAPLAEHIYRLKP